MSKKNLQSAPVQQPAPAVVEQPKKVRKPNVVELNPLHIVQPVEIFQTLKANAQAWEEPAEEEEIVAPVEEEVVEEVKENKKLRKAQGFWTVVALLVVVALAAVIVLKPMPYFVALFETLAKAPGNWFVDGSYVPLLAGYAAVVIALSILIRFLAGIKRKPTCGGCEFVKFCWTAVFITIALFAVLAVLNVCNFGLVATELLGLLSAETLSAPQQIASYIFIGLVALLVLVVVITIAHKAKDKKRAK